MVHMLGTTYIAAEVITAASPEIEILKNVVGE
jgi:hypothetical protein